MEPKTSESFLSDLLRDGEWSKIWEALPSLSLYRCIELLPLLKAVDWAPDVQEPRVRYQRALEASARFHSDVGLRGGLFPTERTLACQAYIRSLQITQDGRYIVSGSGPTRKDRPPGAITVWDAETGLALSGAVVDRVYVDRLRLSPGGQLLAASGYDGQISMLGLPGCNLVKKFDRHRVHSFHEHKFGPDGSLVAATFFGSLPDRPRVTPGKGCNSLVHNLVAFSPPDWNSREMEASLHAGQVWGLAVNEDNTMVAAGLALGEDLILVRDNESGKVARVLRGHDDSVKSLSFSPDGQFLASASYDGIVMVWNTIDWAQCARVQNARRSSGEDPHRLPQYCVAFSGDGKMMAAAEFGETGVEADCSLLIIDVPSFQTRFRLTDCPRKPDHFLFAASGKALVVGTIEGLHASVQVWSTVTGKLLHSFPSAYIPSVSTDGRRLCFSTYRPNPEIKVMRMDVLDFLFTPIPDISKAAIGSMLELKETQGKDHVEGALLELASEIFPEILHLTREHSKRDNSGAF